MKIVNALRKQLFRLAPWHVCGGRTYPHDIYWAESKGLAGHFRSNAVFHSEEAAAFWCLASNTLPRSSWRRYVGVPPVLTPGGHWEWGSWVPAPEGPYAVESSPGDPL